MGKVSQGCFSFKQLKHYVQYHKSKIIVEHYVTPVSKQKLQRFPKHTEQYKGGETVTESNRN